MRKKILSMVITLCMLVSVMVVPSVALAARSGSIGDNITWEFDDNGTLTVSGTGEMTFKKQGTLIFIPWTSSEVKSVVIEEGITSIDTRAFAECDKLTNVSLPKSMSKIGWRAFYDCTGLEKVTIPSGVTQIDSDAFYGCTNLKSIEFEDITSGIMNIESGVFKDCISLASIKIPYSVKTIQSNTFGGCAGLKEVDLGNTEEIESGAFLGCKSLKSITLPKTIKSFSALSLEGCESLENVYVNDNENYTAEDGVIFNKDKTHLIMYPCALKNEYYNVPAGVKEVDGFAFLAAKNLKKINLSDGVTTIGRYAFSDCDSLESIVFPQSLINVEAGALRPESIKDIYYCGSEEEWKNINFNLLYDDYNGETLERADIHYNYKNNIIASGVCGDDVTWTVDDNGTLTISGNGEMQAINETNKMWEDYRDEIRTVIIGDGITNIANNAFQFCNNLKEVNISTTVTEIGYKAFMGTAIEKIEIPGSVKKIGMLAFGSCPYLTEVKLNDGLVEMESHVFKMSQNLTEVKLPDSVEILDATFAYSYIKDIFIPKNVKTVSLEFTLGAETVTVDEENPYYSSYDGVLYNKDKTILIGCPWQKAGILKIADGTREIKEMQDTKITGVIVPKSVEAINCMSFSDGMSESLITDIYYEGSEEDWNNIKINHSEFCEKEHPLVPEKVCVHYFNTSAIKVETEFENGTVTGDGVYAKGASVILTASPNSGYQFGGWYIGEEQVSADTTYSFTADSDITLIAKFTEIPRRGGGSLGGSSSGSTGGNTKTDTKDDTKNDTKDDTKDENKDNNQDTPKDDTKNQSNTITLKIGQVEADIFGEKKTNDVAPIIRNDRTMLPVRLVAESLGAAVEWDADKRLVTIIGKNEKDEDVKILITIDEESAIVNGENVELDSPAFIENDRTYTPIRFIAELLGANVDWNGETEEVIIIRK